MGQQLEIMGSGKGKGAGLDQKMLGMILAAVGAVMVIFMIICVATKSWVSITIGTALFDCGLLEDCTNGYHFGMLGSTLQDTREACFGLMIVALLLIVGATVVAVLMIVGIALPMHALIGFGLAFVAFFLEMAAWAKYRDEVGDSSAVEYGYGFGMAIVVWILLLAWMALWIVCHLQAAGGAADGEGGANTEAKTEAKTELPAKADEAEGGAETKEGQAPGVTEGPAAAEAEV